MTHRWFVSACACLLVASLLTGCTCADASGKTLVLLESLDLEKSHSGFFASLRDAGFDLDVRQASDASLQLQRWDEWLYDNLVIFASTLKDFGGSLDVQHILEFVDSGRNLLLATDEQVADPIRELAGELGVDFDESGSKVFDHVSRPVTAENDHSIICSTNVVPTPQIISQPLKGAVVWRGIAASVSPEADLVTVALAASDTAYSFSSSKAVEAAGKASKSSAPVLAGTDIALAALVQLRNNARAAVVGSIDAFSDAFDMTAARLPNGTQFDSGNAQFCKDLALWTFGRRGVLRIASVSHHRVGETNAPDVYTINDRVVFNMQLQHLHDGHWLPYTSDALQVELVMLDPYVRRTLTDHGDGKFSVEMVLPDTYGAFKFNVLHRALGFTYLTYTEQVSIRPYRHNEYERFIPAAYPYYASVTSMMLGFFLFGFMFLYHK